MQSAIELRRKIQGPGQTLGVFISDHLWLGLIEIARVAGLDYVVIDAEHMPHSPERIAEACALGRMINFPVLLRPAGTDVVSIRTAMDLGPCGLLLPMIESVEQLRVVQDGIYMPPRGKRRPGGPANQWLKSYDYESFKRTVEDHVVIIPQIESAVGLSNADAIAAHPITTALGVGPFDLSADLGLCWQPQHPQFKAALARLRAAADKVGKPFWMIGEPESLVKEGYRFLTIGEASAALQGALANSVRALHTLAETQANEVPKTPRSAAVSTPYAASK